MNLQDVWTRAVQFHGCDCPALAIGARATAYVMERFELASEGPYDVVCTAETFSCGIDAIQAVLGCTIGNGKLRVKSKRKMAFRFCDKRTNRSIYLALRVWLQDRAGLSEKILRMPIDKLFLITTCEEVPEKAPNCILYSACAVRNPKPPVQDRLQSAAPRDDLYRNGFDRDW